MEIREPKEMICKTCGKKLKSVRQGIGIPVFKVFYFEREWICLKCFKIESKKNLKRKIDAIYTGRRTRIF